MSRFVLQPGRILRDNLVVDRSKEPITLTFQELLQELVPARELGEAKKLGMLKMGCFVGQTRHSKVPGKKNVFVFFGVNGSGDISRELAADDTLESRFEKIYRVELAEYDSSFTDMSPPIEDPSAALASP